MIGYSSFKEKTDFFQSFKIGLWHWYEKSKMVKDKK
jgi:hypothetical protein